MTDPNDLIARLSELQASATAHKMVPAACPGGMQCENCLGYATEISFALGPVCPKPKTAEVPLDLLPAIIASLQSAEAMQWQPIETAPHACHVLGCWFDHDWGEWIMGVVASPPSRPFTHWRMLPEPPALG